MSSVCGTDRHLLDDSPGKAQVLVGEADPPLLEDSILLCPTGSLQVSCEEAIIENPLR